ncbi:MAG TPA: hypothetical protein VF659_00490 [Pyrinomonadaceae bacterium]|jgi:hypothetical protein
MTDSKTPAGQNPTEQLMIQLRLEGVKEANRRARYAFLASTVASLSIMITVWNAYGSWNRFLPFLKGGAFATSEVTQWAQKELLSEWVKDHTISNQVLGIRVSIFDAALLGSVSVYVISMWFFYSLRRANRAIGSLLRDTKDAEGALVNMVYYGVADQLIFAETGQGDEPISDLDTIKDPVPRGIVVRYAYQALFFLPGLAILSIVVGDMLSLALEAPFRQGTPVLLPHLKDMSADEWVKLICMELIAVFLTYEAFKLGWKCLRFEKATGEILKQYSNLLLPHGATGRRAAGRPRR